MTSTYHDRLRDARLRRGYSQAALAARIGVSVTTVGHVERGSRDLTAPKLFAWAHACGVALDAIADGPAPTPAPDPTLVELDLHPSEVTRRLQLLLEPRTVAS